MNRQCAAAREGGKRCEAKPLKGSRFCFFHDPDKAEERKAASAAGGRVGALKTLPPNTPRVSVRTPADVMILIEATINQVLRGELSPHVANSVAILTGLHLKAAALQIEAERVGALENFPRR